MLYVIICWLISSRIHCWLNLLRPLYTYLNVISHIPIHTLAAHRCLWHVTRSSVSAFIWNHCYMAWISINGINKMQLTNEMKEYITESNFVKILLLRLDDWYIIYKYMKGQKIPLDFYAMYRLLMALNHVQIRGAEWMLPKNCYDHRLFVRNRKSVCEIA